MECNRLVDVGRRQFLHGSAIAAAGVAVATVAPTSSQTAPASAQSAAFGWSAKAKAWQLWHRAKSLLLIKGRSTTND